MSFLAEHLFSILAISLLAAFSVASGVQRLRLQRKLKSLQAAPDKHSIITHFLNEQDSKTQRLKNTSLLAMPGLNKKALRMRHAYLKIESRMLESHTYNSRDYYIGLVTHLTQLLKILDGDHEHQEEIANSLHQAAESIQLSASERAEIIECIETLLQRAHSAQLDSAELHALGKRVLAILKQQDDPKQRQRTAKAYALSELQKKTLQQTDQLKHVAHTNRNHNQQLISRWEDTNNAAQLLEKAREFEQENHRLSMQISLLQHELNSSRRSAFGQTQEDVQEAASLADQLIEFNEQEIRKLKNTIRSQKKIIFDLQESLEKHTSISPQEREEYTEQLAQLQRNLAQAETCIEMLEQELAQLRERFNSVKHLEEAAQSEALKAQLSAITEAIKPATTEASQQKNELAFIQEAIAADSLEDLSLLIYQYYLDQQHNPVLLITHKNRRIEMCGNGNFSPKQKNSLAGLRPNESTYDRSSGQLHFQYQYIGGILTLPPNSSAEQENALKIARIADRVIDKIMANHANRQLKKQIEAGSNIAKQLARDIENAYDQQINTCKTVIFDNFKNIQNLLQSKNATPTQIASVKQSEQDILEELMANNSYRIKLRREFINLVKKIEDK
ncbi:MAG TPA: hypothetical protein PKZ52_02300 [Cellvibrionaceae bacterium]|nr:hypothetical protein [Cellvibrionaceae bacterium]